ncbi:glycosyl hydrolase family 43 [Halopolyspora algeriensis]|uniref:Glycosyl hydrolase family 43 n=1 Tax=Halopolyspora algeriensis TaxID=1500506 RepID=A0A368VSP0_9ACTN|nr:glycosyl hydrolase family 43 [Halopolyspora algeriensis]TQM56066.1 glycosyl hydrolase family 43 [Halopolyspora algeriensis]
MCRGRILSVLIALPLVLAMGPVFAMEWGGGHRAPRDGAGARTLSTNATHGNAAAVPGTDPHVLHDRDSGYYYAYSTTGADPGYRFAVHRSPDLTTWERLPGGALAVDDGDRWGRDRFRAPEVYHNTETGLYYLFYSARAEGDTAGGRGEPAAEPLGRIGVAVAESPRGPFRPVADEPLDYHPYVPDRNGADRTGRLGHNRPTETSAGRRTVPSGTRLSMADPHVLFDSGRTYLYFSGSPHRVRGRDHGTDRGSDPSAVYAVELTTGWWHDPTGRTMPTIRPGYVDANRAPESSAEVRRDGFTPVLGHRANAGHRESSSRGGDAVPGGASPDPHRPAGPTVVVHHRTDNGRRVPVYYLLYSSTHGRGGNRIDYAVSDSPLGPWNPSAGTPIPKQDGSKGLSAIGQGSVVAAPDGSQLYSVHHGRTEPDAPRTLITARVRFLPGDTDARGNPSLRIDPTIGDEPVPPGVAPYSLTTDARLIDLGGQRAGTLRWTVTGTTGAAMDLSRPVNRVRATLDPSGPVTVALRGDRATLTGHQTGVAALHVQYQRRRSRGAYVDIANIRTGGGRRVSREPVAATVAVAGCTSTITGSHPGPLHVSAGVACLRDAVVTGPVRVAPEASLVAVRSAIAGPIEAHRPGAVWLAGGTVSGPVRIDRATGIVRLDGTTVSGRVSVTGSSGGVTVVRSALHGSVSVHGNAGTRPIVVAGNRIAGALACTGNVPLPAGDRRLNSVRGATSEQCTSLQERYTR